MSDLSDIVKTAVPWIATALGGPLGGLAAEAAGKVLGLDDRSVATVKSALSGATPEQMEHLKEVELQVQVQLAQMGYDSLYKLEELNTRVLEATNKTMQVEATAEHWPTYSWRPYNGFLFGTTIFCTYFLLPICKIPVPTIPVEVWITWGGILGIASYFRGKAQADPNIPATVQIPFSK